MAAAWGQAAVGVAAGTASLGRRAADCAARRTGKGRLVFILLHALHGRAVADVAAGETAELGASRGIAGGVRIAQRTAGRTAAEILALKRFAGCARRNLFSPSGRLALLLFRFAHSFAPFLARA